MSRIDDLKLLTLIKLYIIILLAFLDDATMQHSESLEYGDVKSCLLSVFAPSHRVDKIKPEKAGKLLNHSS